MAESNPYEGRFLAIDAAVEEITGQTQAMSFEDMSWVMDGLSETTEKMIRLIKSIEERAIASMKGLDTSDAFSLEHALSMCGSALEIALTFATQVGPELAAAGTLTPAAPSTPEA